MEGAPVFDCFFGGIVLFFMSRWRRTQVAKGTLCKSVMHRFESDRRLSKNASKHMLRGVFPFKG